MLRLDFTQNLPADIPSSLKIFSLEKARVDQTLVVNVLSSLGLMSDSNFYWRNNGGWITAESKDARVSINQRSGAIRFWTRLNDRDLPKIPLSIDEPHLIFIARGFLKKTGFVDSYVDKLKVRKIAYLRMQTASVSGKVTTPRILDAGMILDGI